MTTVKSQSNNSPLSTGVGRQFKGVGYREFGDAKPRYPQLIDLQRFQPGVPDEDLPDCQPANSECPDGERTDRARADGHRPKGSGRDRDVAFTAFFRTQ